METKTIGQLQQQHRQMEIQEALYGHLFAEGDKFTVTLNEVQKEMLYEILTAYGAEMSSLTNRERGDGAAFMISSVMKNRVSELLDLVKGAKPVREA